MPSVETILLALVVLSGLGCGMFMRAKAGTIVLMIAFVYFLLGFVLFDKAQPLWFVTLMMGFCLAVVGALASVHAGRALSKLLPRRD